MIVLRTQRARIKTFEVVIKSLERHGGITRYSDQDWLHHDKGAERIDIIQRYSIPAFGTRFIQAGEPPK
jgi:hypothetical protein